MKVSLVVAGSHHLTSCVSGYSALSAVRSSASSASAIMWSLCLGGHSRCLDYMCPRASGLAAEKLFHGRRAPRLLHAAPADAARRVGGMALSSGPATSSHYVAQWSCEVRARR